MVKKGGYHDFPSKNFCLRVPKFFVVENFCAVFQKVSGSGKLYVLERGYQDVTSRSFCLTMPKTLNFRKLTICVVFQ